MEVWRERENEWRYGERERMNGGMERERENEWGYGERERE
jgi:hypothetical protein